MIAYGKAAFDSRFRFRRTGFTLILMGVRRLSQTAVSLHGQHRNRAADVVRHQQMTPLWRQRNIHRSRPAGRHLIQLGQFTVCPDA
ncbi:hypothetical protein D3C81_1319920 [compost metagenome]